jgi:hypothetical protein|tara:strand:+ start:289 stop:456 length:168 start_codon:yes stop_codon:yes gene_type:complete
VQGELIKSLQKQVKEWEDWKVGSKDSHAKEKANADISISKHKNTLCINTTRKRKK